MESSGSKDNKQEFAEKELHQLVQRSYALGIQIIGNSLSDEFWDTGVPATTHEAENKGMNGRLFVTNPNRMLVEVTFDETGELSTDDDTTERFEISYDVPERKYTIHATGKQPNIVQSTLNEGGGEDEFEAAMNTYEEYLKDQFHPATPFEILRLSKVLEIGLFGDTL